MPDDDRAACGADLVDERGAERLDDLGRERIAHDPPHVVGLHEGFEARGSARIRGGFMR
ncbi:hypothetical protein GCM10025870_07860 [Agromyces marinus]|uniref:Uncharacterized protein n=1 Tax=Agromyces marinus TaxID=1389020 RepID=A0ABN6Y935_9MICO|nr:hypothetical protein GCM10025870_07860 [Agromyces marinus]